MYKIFLIILFLSTFIVHSQISQNDFESEYPEIKELSVMSNKLEMGYEDQYINESNFIAYKVNGIYVLYDNEKWFIPHKKIQSIGTIGEEGLIIYLKG